MAGPSLPARNCSTLLRSEPAGARFPSGWPACTASAGSSGALHEIASNALAGSRIEIREPDSRFRWCFVDDVGQAVELLLSGDLPAEHVTAILASRDTFSLADVATQVVRLAGSDSPVKSAIGGPDRYEVMNIDRLCGLVDFAPTFLEKFLPDYLDRLRSG